MIGFLLSIFMIMIPLNIVAASQRNLMADSAGEITLAPAINDGSHQMLAETATDIANQGVSKSGSLLQKTLPQRSTLAQTPTKNKLKFENILLYISTWWFSNPLRLQIWYLFCFIALGMYLVKLRQFRRPLLFLSIIILGFYLGNSLDPIAAIFGLVPSSNFTFDAAFYILGIAVLLSLFLGRFYCGWICPLGAVQEFIHPGTVTGSGSGAGIRMPVAFDALLKYLKYLILLIFLYLAWRTGGKLWDSYEPLNALVHFNGSGLTLFILVVMLAISTVIERPFCRYICPLGAVLALTSRLALFRMRPDAGVCMVCGKCSGGNCPMDAIEVDNKVTDLPEIQSTECIYCLRCQKICQRSALRITAHRINKVLTD